MFWKAVIITCLAVGALAELEVPEDKKELLRSALRAQCKKNGAEDKSADVEKAATAFVDCVKGLFDVETVKKEIEEAKPNGALDEVFGKYCAKSGQLKTCIHTLLGATEPCLDAETRPHVASARNASDQLIDFICYKDGDRIALFIAEKGPECFQEKAEDIRQCFERVKTEVATVENAKNLSTVDKCRKFDEVSMCAVRALEACDTPTPGNMAESLFKYVRKSSPCHQALPKTD